MRDGASRTAVLVCQGRAAANGRIEVGRLDDPVAMELLREDERLLVAQVRDAAVPKRLAERLDYEFVRGCATVMAPRTIAIDDAVREQPAPQVVLLGAGLDARAWRMPELADTVAFEVDHPASQADKRERLGARAPAAREVRFVATDFGEQRLDTALAAAGHDPATPTTWVWEGVIPYLAPAQVEATLGVVSARSPAGSRLVVQYQVRSASAGVGRLFARVLMRLAGRTDPWRDEPHRSNWTPEQLSALLAEHGFVTVQDQSLLQVCPGLTDDRGSLANGHVLVAERR